MKVEQQRDRRNRRELDARKGKEGESEGEAAEIHARRDWNEKKTWVAGMRNEVERTGENWTQGKGRKGKEAEGNTREQGRRDPWRNLYRTVERTGENWTQGKGRKGKEAENAKGGETPLEREDERSGETWTKGRGRKRSATKGH